MRHVQRIAQDQRRGAPPTNPFANGWLSNSMDDAWLGLGFIGIWLFLQLWVLPRFAGSS